MSKQDEKPYKPKPWWELQPLPEGVIVERMSAKEWSDYQRWLQSHRRKEDLR